MIQKGTEKLQYCSETCLPNSSDTCVWLTPLSSMSPLHSSVSSVPYYYTLTCTLLCNLLLLVLAFSFVSPTKLHAPKQRQRFCLLLLCLPQCAVHGCECTALDGSDSAAFFACLGKAILNLIVNFNKCDRWPQTKVSPNLAITPKTGIQSYLSLTLVFFSRATLLFH